MKAQTIDEAAAAAGAAAAEPAAADAPTPDAATPVATIGRIVNFTLTDRLAEQVNTSRERTNPHLAADGAQTHAGNPVAGGDVYPMMIVRVWEGGLVQGQVFLDGNDTLWVTSVSEGADPGQFAWPVRK